MANTQLRKYFSFELKLFIVGFLLLSGAGLLSFNLQKPDIQLTKQETALNINQNILLYLNAGNKRFLTDLLWIQTLIESDLERYQKKDLNNWLFLRFNTIALLDPKFYENYLYGGQFLAIIKDDLEGAEIIYDKGLVVYPNDYRLNYNAGFLNYYEMGNNEKGITYLKRIQDNPKAPVFIRSIVNKLEVEAGMGLEEVFNLVLHNYETTPDEALKTKLRSDLYAIKAEIDLKCLNNNEIGCSRKDLDGNDYLKEGEVFRTQKSFLPYRINKRGETMSPLPRQEIDTVK